MEIFNNIWNILTTENETLVHIMYIPLAFIEAYIDMYLFSTILKFTSDKRQKIIYVSLAASLGIICTFFIPKPYSNIITLVSLPIAIKYIFNTNFAKGILAEFIPVVCITVLEIILSKIFFSIFSLDYTACASIPLYRLIINIIIYSSLFIIAKISKNFNLYINFFSNISKKNKYMLLANIIFAFIVIFMQMYLIVYYNSTLPTGIILINVLFLIAYFLVSIYSLVKTMRLSEASQDLEQEKLTNKTLQILHDNIRAFKHDFSNIIAGIGGYVETNDMAGLKKYYSQLLLDCNQINNLSSLSPDAVNNPAVYTVLANKYYKADNLGIKISLDCFIDFNKLNMQIYEFTRILGILMDNAIEAASECNDKIINVIIRNDPRRNRQLLIVENTYKNKSVDLEKIYEKGFSTKEHNTGLGLWEVNKIIKKHSNLARFTTKNDKFFKQQIEIYTK